MYGLSGIFQVVASTNNAPEFSDDTLPREIAENTPADGFQSALDVSWREPDPNGGPAIAGYQVRYREGASGEWRDWSHEGTGTGTTITGLKAETPAHQEECRATHSPVDRERFRVVCWAPRPAPARACPAI